MKLSVQLDKAKEAKRRARKAAEKAASAIRGGLHQRVIQDKRRKPEKHKKPFGGDE